MPDYIPHADADFHEWFVKFTNYVTSNAAALGVTAAQQGMLAQALANWNTTYPAHQIAHANATAATNTKNTSLKTAHSVLRPLIRQLQANTTVTDAQRQAMQIGVHSTAHTSAPIPTTAPVATVNASQRLQHTLSFQDSAPGATKAKPAGVSGCEIWEKIGGPAPTDVSQMMYLATATRTPFAVPFTGAQAGQTVYYWLRWVNTTGEKGPWSQPISAPVAG